MLQDTQRQKIWGYSLAEILLLISVIFTMASLMLWFNYIQPVKAFSSSEKIEISKHKLYNIWQENEYYFQNNVNQNTPTIKSDSCYKEIQSYSIGTWLKDQYIKELNQKDQEFNQAYNNINNLEYDSIWKEVNLELIRAWNIYIDDYIDNINKEYEFYNQVVPVLKLVSKYCDTKDPDLITEIVDMTSLIEVNKYSTLWLNNISEFFENPMEFDIEVFFDLSKLAEDAKATMDNNYENLKIAFQNLENWQRTTSKDLIDNFTIIYIYKY